MIGAVWKLITFTNMVNRIINTGSNERIIPQVYDTCLQMFDVCTLGHTAHIKRQPNSRHTLISMSSAMILHFFLYKGTPVV